VISGCGYLDELHMQWPVLRCGDDNTMTFKLWRDQVLRAIDKEFREKEMWVRNRDYVV
jgi:hypothetical protein